MALRHPWIFRDQLSSAATVFTDGDWLRLVDGANRVIGYGIFEATGAIAIRMLRRGPAPPDAAWLRSQLAAAIAKREPLAARTNGIRLVNGESDGIPAVVVDRFGDAAIVASYSAGADALARYVALALRATVPRVVSRPARRRILHGLDPGRVSESAIQIAGPPDAEILHGLDPGRVSESAVQIAAPLDVVTFTARRRARISTCAGCAAPSRRCRWPARVS